MSRRVDGLSISRQAVFVRLLWLLALVGCTRPAENPHREAARAVLEERCGKCHRSDSPDANARALKVFTLNEIDFAARMTDVELEDTLGRFTGEISDNEDIRPDELRTIRAFVESERRRRAQTTR
jgi:hypothetical protein